MKKLFSAALVVAAVSVLGAQSAVAQEISTASTRLRLVRAFCTTGPCRPSLNFEVGSAKINRIKQPKPLTRRKIGRIRLKGVTWTGTQPSAFTAIVNARFYWDIADPDGDCPHAGMNMVDTLATSSMFCPAAVDRVTCNGDLLVPEMLFDTRCTDVRFTLGELSVEVFEFGLGETDEAKIAVNGLSIVGAD